MKEETKNGRENTDMNKRTVELKWIDFDWSFYVDGCDCLADSSDDSLFMFGRNVLNTKKMKITR